MPRGLGRVVIIIVGYFLVAWVLVWPTAGWSLYNQAHSPDLPNPMSLMVITSLDDYCFSNFLCVGSWRSHVWLVHGCACAYGSGWYISVHVHTEARGVP